MWGHVAARKCSSSLFVFFRLRSCRTDYASWPYIAAFEVMSEPRDKGASAAVVTDFYTKACAAAQAAAPGTPCVVGPGPYYKLWNFDDSILIKGNRNVIYTFDYFVPDDYIFGRVDKATQKPPIPSYPGNYSCAELVGGNPWTAKCCPHGGDAVEAFDADWTAANFARAAALRAKAAVPVFVNQWSVVHGSAEQPAPGGRYAYMRDVARALQAADIGWAWWVWRGGGSGWSHGSSEFVYRYTGGPRAGTVELDTAAFDAVRPYLG